MRFLKTIVLFFAIYSNAQDFGAIVATATDIDYYLTDGHNRRQNTLKPVKPEVKDNWYNLRVGSINTNNPIDGTILPKVNEGTIKSIDIYYIKGKKDLGGKLFGRAELQQWTFGSAKQAAEALLTIESTSKILRERIQKSPWAVWQKDNKLYFMILGGHYMLGAEYDKVLKWFKQKTGSK